MSLKENISSNHHAGKFHSTISDQLLSSCVGSIFTSAFVTPFDVVKTRLQVQVKPQSDPKACSVYELCIQENQKLIKGGIQCCEVRKIPYKGTVDAFVKISRYEGVTSLWSGLLPTLLISVPSTVIYFTAYDQLREAFSSHFVPPLGAVSVPFLSGTTARILTGTITSPLEFLRTKKQSEQIKYSDAFRSIAKLVKVRGYLSLWHGWVPTTLRDVPFSAIYWTTYEQLKLLTPDPSAFKFFIFGATAGTIAAVVTLPFDVIKTHRQSELGGGKIITRTTQPRTIDLLMDLYRKGGVQSLFAGILPRILKIAPACAIMISSYELGKVYFSERRINALETDKHL